MENFHLKQTANPSTPIYFFPVFQSVERAADRAYSYVVVTTKVIPEQFRTHELLAPLLSETYVRRFPQPTYVLMQNGLNIELDLVIADDGSSSDGRANSDYFYDDRWDDYRTDRSEYIDSDDSEWWEDFHIRQRD